MNKLNFLQPDKNNLNTYLYTGVILVALSIFIVFLNSFFNKDIFTSMLIKTFTLIFFTFLLFIPIQNAYAFIDYGNAAFN